MVLVKLNACKRKKINPYLSSCTQFNFKYSEDLNIRPDILNLIEEKARNSLEFHGTEKDFLNRA